MASPAAEWWVVQEWRPGCDQSQGCIRTRSLSSLMTKSAPRAWASWQDTGKAPPAPRTCLVARRLQNFPPLLAPAHQNCLGPGWGWGGVQVPVPLAPEIYQDGDLLSHKLLAEMGTPTVLIPVCRVTCQLALQPQVGTGSLVPLTRGHGGCEWLALALLSHWAE